MDPSKNNSFDSSDSGEKNPNSAGTPPNTGAINPPEAGATSQNAGSSAAVSSRPTVAPISNPAVAKPASSTGAFAPGAYRPMSARPMNPGMMPTAPIASGGTGDIVLSKDTGGNKSKKWWIIGGVVGALLVVILVVFAIINNGGFGGAKATDLRSAFNIYANYFLTGEAKDEEIVEPELSFEEELEEEEDGAEEVEDLIEDLSDAEENGEIEEELDSYFSKYISGGTEDNDEYLTNLRRYFNSFYNYFINEMDKYQFAIEYVDDYKNNLNLAITYHDGSTLERDVLYEKYKEGGRDAVEGYIDEVSSSYDDIIVNNSDDESFREILIEYGEAELRQLEWYREVGCLKDGDVDYDCVEEKEDERSAAIEDSLIKYDLTVKEFIETAVATVNNGVFKLKSIVDEDASEFYEDSTYVREKDKDEEEEDEDEE